MNTTDGTQGKRPSTCYLSHGSTIYRSQDIDVEKIPSWSNHIELATHSDNTLTDRYNDMVAAGVNASTSTIIEPNDRHLPRV